MDLERLNRRLKQARRLLGSVFDGGGPANSTVREDIWRWLQERDGWESEPTPAQPEAAGPMDLDLFIERLDELEDCLRLYRAAPAMPGVWQGVLHAMAQMRAVGEGEASGGPAEEHPNWKPLGAYGPDADPLDFVLPGNGGMTVREAMSQRPGFAPEPEQAKQGGALFCVVLFDPDQGIKKVWGPYQTREHANQRVRERDATLREMGVDLEDGLEVMEMTFVPIKQA